MFREDEKEATNGPRAQVSETVTSLARLGDVALLDRRWVPALRRTHPLPRRLDPFGLGYGLCRRLHVSRHLAAVELEQQHPDTERSLLAHHARRPSRTLLTENSVESAG